MSKVTWPDKDPDEVLDYGLDWSARGRAGAATGDAIAVATATTVTGGVVVDQVTWDGMNTVTWLSGGVDGETCEILIRVTTEAGRIMDQTVRIKIKSR